MDDLRTINILKGVNVFFWFIWAAIPFCIAASLSWWDMTTIFEGPNTVCSETAMKGFSENGKIATTVFFVIDTMLSIILFALMHILVHASASGRVFIQKTLSILGYMAALVTAWPFISIGSLNITKYYLFSIGDLPSFDPEYMIDVVMLGCGLFVFVLRLIFRHALNLHEDARLTV